VTCQGARWVEPLCRIAPDFRLGGLSIRELFERVAPDLTDEYRVRSLVRRHLAAHPALIEAWQTYSYDKRSSPSPYLDGKEVGYYDGRPEDVVLHDDEIAACADFICREAAWILERRRSK